MATSTNSIGLKNVTISMEDGTIMEIKKDGEVTNSVQKVVNRFAEDENLSVSIANITRKELYRFIEAMDGKEGINMNVKAQYAADELLADADDEE